VQDRTIRLCDRHAVHPVCFDVHDVARDPVERYCAADTMKIAGSIFLTAGVTLYSAKGNPLFTIVEDTCGFHDTIGGCCSRESNRVRFGVTDTPNCRDNFLRALEPHGLGLRDIVANINFFMYVPVDSDGAMAIVEGRSKAGDYVDLLACMDTLCVPVVCGSGDVTLVSNFSLKPLDVSVFEATSDSLARVAEIEEQFAAPLSRQGPADFRQPNIRVERELTQDPAYERAFGRYPLQREQLTVGVDAATAEGLAGMVEAGHGRDLSDALFVGTRNGHRGGPLADHRDTIGDRIDDVQAVAELERERLARDRRAITDADDLEINREAGGNAGHDIIDETANRPPHLAGTLRIVGRPDHNLFVLDLDLDRVVERHAEFAKLALGGQVPGLDLDIDAVGNGDWIFADS